MHWRLTIALLMLSPFAFAQLTPDDITLLQRQAVEEGWTFEVGPTSATDRPLDTLRGLVVPEDWRESARFVDFDQKVTPPSYFNWQEVAGCPPIRDQKSCNSCWAFATTGALECAIYIKDGNAVDLSEQWLVSCNQETIPPVLPYDDPTPSWGCNGGWFAFEYFQGSKTDSCGGSGAVLEQDFPYTATDAACNCPYPHAYTIDDWAFIGPELAEANVDAIKQAILSHGPVATGIYAGLSFSGYKNGVFNADSNEPPNHSFVIIGWDDNRGSEGAWRVRNGWGDDWGEAGYMWIEYGCSSVGFGACYIDYPGVAEIAGPEIIRQPVGGSVAAGWFHCFTVEAEGLGLLQYDWWHNGQSMGVDTPKLCIEGVTAADTGSYACHVTDLNGTVITAAAELTLDEMVGVPALGGKALAILTLSCLLAAIVVLRRETRLG